MQRRTFVKYLGAGSVAAVLGGAYWLSRGQGSAGLAVSTTLSRLQQLDPVAIETRGSWDIARTFNHLAQSVEFSMTGFPVMKSAVFQHTVGRLAFSVFNARGSMMHGLDEVIPGEVVVDAAKPDEALERLISALERFEAFEGELMPHFAYGQLDKAQYAVAHVLHINNHFEEFRGV